jgi:MFS family permease
MTVFSVLFFQAPTFYGAALLLTAIGFSGGFFAVPVMAIIQHRPDPKRKGGVIAASNQLSFIAIGLGSVLYWALESGLHVSIPAVFLIGGLMTLVATIYAVWLMPDSLLRLMVFVLVHSVYRMRVKDATTFQPRAGLSSSAITSRSSMRCCSADRRNVTYVF